MEHIKHSASYEEKKKDPNMIINFNILNRDSNKKKLMNYYK